MSSQAVAAPTATPAPAAAARSAAASRRRSARSRRAAANSSRTVVRANGAASPSASRIAPRGLERRPPTSASQSAASAASGASARYHSTIVNSVRWCGPDSSARQHRQISKMRRHPVRDQPLEVVLGRGDQPVRSPPDARGDGVEVDLLARRADARRRLDLEEPLRSRTRRAPRARCGRALRAPRARPASWRAARRG